MPASRIGHEVRLEFARRLPITPPAAIARGFMRMPRYTVSGLPAILAATAAVAGVKA